MGAGTEGVQEKRNTRMWETGGENATESGLQVGQKTHRGRRQFPKSFEIASPTDITPCSQRAQLCDCVGLLIIK
jgi:hypothetical protein